MIVTSYISKDFIPPNLNQTVGHCLNLIHEFNLTHIPLFEGLSFIGNISKENLEEMDDQSKVSDVRDLISFFYISENGSLLEAIQKFHLNECNVLPVLSLELTYIGMLMMEDVISGISTMPFIAEPGGIMIVEVSKKQFSISEIAKIAESNNARIFGLFITDYSEEKVQVTIKLKSDSIVSVAETFERFGYEVVYKFFNDERQDLYKDRFDQLMKYLDI